MHLSSSHTLILTSEDIQKIIRHYGLDFIMDAFIDKLRNVIRDYDPKKQVVPARSGFNYQEPEVGLVEWMPVLDAGKKVVNKIVGYHPNNPLKFALPTILSTISSYDVKTGHLICLMDGVLSTALRTGAASAIATEILAKKDSKVLGLIGCGAQSITQLHALSRIYEFEKVYLYDIDPASQNSFQERCASLDLKIEFSFESIDHIVENADIICTATSIEVGEGPLFQGLKTQAHTHINAVGSDFPGKVELPLDFVEQSFICADFRAQALIEGECQRLSAERIDADFVEIVRNPKKYQAYQFKNSLFDSTGWALEDQVSLELFMEYALETGLGQMIAIENISSDAKDPYQFMHTSQSIKV